MKNKTQLALQWYDTLTPNQQRKAFQELFEHALITEWIGVWEPEDRADLAEQTGQPIETYAAPYFRTCGEPLVK